jgi:hypothetical protein
MRDSLGATLFLVAFFFVGAAVVAAICVVVIWIQGDLGGENLRIVLAMPVGGALFGLLIGVGEMAKDELKRLTANCRRRRWIARRRRRAARHRGTRDIELIAEMSPTDWRSVRQRALRAIHRWTLRRFLGAPLVVIPSAFFALLGWKIITQLMPEIAGIVFAVLVVGSAIGLRLSATLSDTASHRGGDPLVLLGRVLTRRVPKKIELAAGDSNTQAALRASSEGRGRLLEIQVDRAATLSSDGRLKSAAKWHGRHQIPASLSVVRNVQDREHVVLVCSAAGWACSRLGAVVSRTAPRAEAA